MEKKIHIRKEAIDSKYERHMNPCKKCQPQLCNFIKILSKTYTTKITFVSTLSPSSGGIFIAFWTSQTDIRESKFVTTGKTTSNKLVGDTQATIYTKNWKMKYGLQEKICTEVFYVSIWWVTVVQSSGRGDHRKTSHVLSLQFYGFILILADSYC